MCVTDIYVDRFPDGREVEFAQLTSCQYGAPGRPCPTLSTQMHAVRKIQFGEPTTEYILTRPIFMPSTPPRSSDGSRHRHSESHHRHSVHSVSSKTSEDSGHRRHSKHKPTRVHRKERIIIVDAPPTPRTPPQSYPQTFTAPSSPNPQFSTPRRPIIVDERSIRRSRDRAPSVGAVISDRPPSRRRSLSRPRVLWDTPSTSHTSFDLRAEREREERAERRRRESQAELDAEMRRARRIAEADEAIRRRPAVPIPPRPLGQRAFLRPVVQVDQSQSQSQALTGVMAGLTLNERIGERALVDGAAERRRRENGDRVMRERLEKSEQEAMTQRLRERQMPRRRFSVGPGGRRHRVLYDDGVYRWE